MRVAGVVAALAAEARVFGPATRMSGGAAVLADGTLLAVSGIGAAAAARACTLLIDAGATALVSWGMAGALDPSLSAGAVCLPSEIIAADGSCFLTAAYWREPLALNVARQRPVAHGRLLTSAQAIDTVAKKLAAFRDTGAAAVDMESCAVAEVAAARSLPFIAVRAIVDEARDALPSAAVAASLGGEFKIGRLVAGLLRSPADIAPLMRLARRYRAATCSLRCVARLGCLKPPGAA